MKMMKKNIVLLCIVMAFILPLNAQSWNANPDSSKTNFLSGSGYSVLSFKPYQLPDSMTYDEFVKLQRRLSWQRIFAASVVPGYIHFYAGRQRIGWTIAGVRAAGMLLSGYALLDQARHVDNFSLTFFSVDDSLSSLKARSERNLLLFWTGIALNFLGYAFDWAHGDFVIDSERNAVLYKYGSGRSPKPLGGLWIDSRRKIFGAALRLQM